MKQETKLKGETKMKEKTTFKVQEGLAFISTAESKNVSALKEASEKYHVDIPDAKYIIICTDEKIDCYYELVGYGMTEFAFGIPNNLQEDGDEMRHLVMELLANNIDDMSWSGILESYLSDLGIGYEG